MPLFGIGKGSGKDAVGGPPGAEEAGGGPAAEAFSPEKAEVFFERAQHMHETANYEYATTLWLNGLSQDPPSVKGFEGFERSIRQYVENAGKKAKPAEIAKALNGKGVIKKYQESLLQWGLKPESATTALKAADAAGTVGAADITEYLGRIAFRAAMAEKKQRKEVFVKLLDVFEKGGAYRLAVEAGEVARRLDPSDAEIDDRVKTMMAQDAIKRGGFDADDSRKNVRDQKKQQEVYDQDQITKTEDVKGRIIEAARAELAERPDDAPTIEKLGRALMDRGKKQDLLEANTLFNEAYKKSGQFRFRQRAGEALLRIYRNNLRNARLKLEKDPENEDLESKITQLQQMILDTEITEYRLQVEQYPTDLSKKWELGRRLFEKGEYDETIKLLQQAQEDTRLRRGVLNLLARSFQAIGWHDEAIGTFRAAVDGIVDDSSELAMELRYGLGCALEDKAEKDRELEAAEEAERLFSAIAMKKFDYKDIRGRRDHTKKLIGELRR